MMQEIVVGFPIKGMFLEVAISDKLAKCTSGHKELSAMTTKVRPSRRTILPIRISSLGYRVVAMMITRLSGAAMVNQSIDVLSLPFSIRTSGRILVRDQPR